MADNDTDISKIHLNKAEQIIKVDFYLRLQNTENFALSASSASTLILSWNKQGHCKHVLATEAGNNIQSASFKISKMA